METEGSSVGYKSINVDLINSERCENTTVTYFQETITETEYEYVNHPPPSQLAEGELFENDERRKAYLQLSFAHRLIFI